MREYKLPRTTGFRDISLFGRKKPRFNLSIKVHFDGMTGILDLPVSDTFYNNLPSLSQFFSQIQTRRQLQNIDFLSYYWICSTVSEVANQIACSIIHWGQLYGVIQLY